VVLAGGALQQLLMHPSVTPFEQRFVRKPLPGIYVASPSRTFTFEIGAFTVPVSMSLAIAEWHFQIYRFSGVVAGETIPIPEGMSTLNVGCDFNIAQYRKGNVMYEMLPIDPTVNQAAFTPATSGGNIIGFGAINPVAVGVLPQSSIQPAPGTTAQQRAFVMGAGIGSALMPISDRDHQGPSRMPFTYYARQGQAIQMRISVFQRIGYPVAYFEARVAGYLIPENTLDETLKSMKPCHIRTGI
jgi:hypothetical protein